MNSNPIKNEAHFSDKIQFDFKPQLKTRQSHHYMYRFEINVAKGYVDSSYVESAPYISLNINVDLHDPH